MQIFNSYLPELCENLPDLWLSSWEPRGSAPACHYFGKERPFWLSQLCKEAAAVAQRTTNVK